MNSVMNRLNTVKLIVHNVAFPTSATELAEMQRMRRATSDITR